VAAAGGSNQTLIGGAGLSTLIGNLGGNTLIAGSGVTVAEYDGYGDSVNLATGVATANGRADSLIGITVASSNGYATTLIGGSGTDTLSASGYADTLDAGSGTDMLSASGFADTLIAGSGTDMLSASGYADTLLAGTGTSTLAGSGFQEAYQFAAGDGQATIINGSSAAFPASNELDFGTGISDQNLWFVQSGNDLQIDLLGTQSQVTVSNWFGSAGSQLSEITAGGLKIDSQVAQLVQAMATFSADNPGFNPTAATATQAPNDPALQSAIAAAWHS
jgi:Ca2+-binding RTX toxin-like protein